MLEAQRSHFRLLMILEMLENFFENLQTLSTLFKHQKFFLSGKFKEYFCLRYVFYFSFQRSVNLTNQGAHGFIRASHASQQPRMTNRDYIKFFNTFMNKVSFQNLFHLYFPDEIFFIFYYFIYKLWLVPVVKANL